MPRFHAKDFLVTTDTTTKPPYKKRTTNEMLSKEHQPDDNQGVNGKTSAITGIIQTSLLLILYLFFFSQIAL